MMTTWLYRLLLRALPSDMGRRFADDMVADLEARRAEAPGPVARLAVGGGALLDLVRQVVGTRLGGFGGGGLARDVRHGLRGLLRTPAFTVFAGLTLALGIGASAAVYSIVDAILFQPLPYPEADRLVTVWPEENFNVEMVRRFDTEVEALEGVSGISSWTLGLGSGDGHPPLEIQVARVTANHFRVLGIEPAMGRGFQDGEDRTGSDGVAILSHAFWVSRFGGDPDIVGRTVPISGAGHDTRTVVGVMPADHLPVIGRSIDAWIPLATEAETTVASDDSWYVNWRVARLAPGVTLERAGAEIETVARAIVDEIPESLEAETLQGLFIQPLRDERVGTTGPLLQALLGAVGLVLLLACVNVANLLLARGEARSHAWAVRTALGAGRGRLVRQALVETGVLAALGAIPGALLAVGLVRLVTRHASEALPRGLELGVDGRVLGAAVAAALLAALVSGVLPALRTSSVAPARAFRAGRSGTDQGRGGARRTLVAVELALGAVIVVASGLLVRTLANLTAVDPGFRTENVLVHRGSPNEITDQQEMADFYDRYLERLRALPGVEAASAIHLLPGTTSNWSFPVHVDGHPVPEGTPAPAVNVRIVTDGYFETMGIPVLAGRAPGREDGSGDLVMAVNESFVERFWPEGDPLGRELRMWGRTSDPLRAIGVVADVRQHGLTLEPRPEVYVSTRHWPYGAVSMHTMIRTRGEPLGMVAAVRAALAEADPRAPMSDVHSMDEVLADSIATQRLVLAILGGFGIVALVLAAVGVYAVTAHSAQERRGEFGLRLALGGTQGSIVRRSVRRLLGPALLGLAVGLAGAWAAGGLLETVLYGVAPRDPVTFAAVGLLLIATAIVASALPAWRATRVDPASTLRGSEG